MLNIRSKINIVEISSWTFIKMIIAISIVWFLYTIRDILTILFVSLILSSVLDPLVGWLKVHKIPRAVSLLFLYVLFGGVFLLIFVLLVPVMVRDSQSLFTNLSLFWHDFSRIMAPWFSFSTPSPWFEEIGLSLRSFAASLATNGADVVSIISGLLGGIFSFFLIAIITFYMTVEEDAIKKTFHFLAPLRYQAPLVDLFIKIQKKIGLWLRGQIILSFMVGGLCYVGLFFLNMPYALVLAAIAALTELVPYVGPILGAIPALILALTHSTVLGFSVLILYIIVQQLENNLLVPQVMQKQLGLNPILSITALLIGVQIGGVLGAFLAIPVATALNVIIIEWFHGNGVGTKNLKTPSQGVSSRG